MGRLLFAILRGKKKKYLILMAGIAVCTFFLTAVDTMYQGYCEAQLGNAYSTQGDWDVCVRIDGADYARFIKGFEGLTVSGFHSTTYCLRLELVSEDQLYGHSAEVITHYYLALYGITGEEGDVLPYHLAEGRWPESEGEIVVPETLRIGDRAASKGTIRIGDTFTFESGRRRAADGKYTQEQISGKEDFERAGEREYTICGFLDYPEYTTDKYVLYGYTGLTAAEQYPGEELVVYYKLAKLTSETLEQASRRLAGEEGVLEVRINTALDGALNVVEHSDYLHSVRLGLYLFEGLIVLVAFCIAAANQYQGMMEDKRQIGLFDSVGASRGQLCALYCVANLLVVCSGFVLSFALYGIFILLVRTSLLSKLRNSYFQTGIYTPDLQFACISLLVFAAGLSAVVCRLLLAQLPARRQKRTEKRRTCARQPEVKDVLGLAGSNNRAMRTRYWVQVLISCVVLAAVPMFLSIFLSAYRIGERLTRSASNDFYFQVSGFFNAADDELRNNPDVKLFQREAFGVRKAYVPVEYIPANVEEVLRQRTGHVISDMFMDDNTMETGVTLLFVGEENYNLINKLNHGTLPPYEEFIDGDNAILRSVFLLPDTEQWVDVGKEIAARMTEIELYPYTENEIFFKVNIIGSLFEDYADDMSVSLRLFLYVPEHLYEDYCKDTGMYIGTTYGIDGYKGRLEQLGKSLQEMAGRYDMHFQDNVSESSAAKDALVIQYVTCLACAVVVVLMCACAMGVMGKVDFIARQKTYRTYRTLGLARRKAFVIQLLEHLLPFSSAVLISVILHYIAAFTFLRGVYLYYGITLRQVGGFVLLTVAGAAVLLVLDAVHITNQRYQIGLEQAQ